MFKIRCTSEATETKVLRVARHPSPKNFAPSSDPPAGAFYLGVFRNTQEAARKNMRSTSTALFRKQRTCPPAETILLRGQSATVAEHVAGCDFCGAEAQLLSLHAPPAEALPFADFPMPASLRRLAEDLLAEPSYNRARFAGALVEIERLTLTDA